MHILYLDESGTHNEARYFVVAGLAVFERETYFLAKDLDQLQARFLTSTEGPIPLHASPLRAPEGRGLDPYAALNNPQRRELLQGVYQTIARSRARLFAVAMEKAFLRDEPYERGFEEIVNRFDRMLGRIGRDTGEQQRGLIVVAESNYQSNLQLFARKIWSQGHRWGETHNLADIPYFAPAANTRLLQLADFVSNAVYGRYENGYTRDFDIITPRFDQQDGRLHGLVHLAYDSQSCYCPACMSRRMVVRNEPEEPLMGLSSP